MDIYTDTAPESETAGQSSVGTTSLPTIAWICSGIGIALLVIGAIVLLVVRKRGNSNPAQKGNNTCFNIL